MSHSTSGRIVTLQKGLTIEKVAKRYKTLGIKLLFCPQVSEAIEIENQRSPTNQGYCIRVWDDYIPDETLARWSSEDIIGCHINTMTLLERLQFGIDYFLDYGEHPDNDNAGTITLCAATIFKVETSYKRYTTGIPTVCFFMNEVIVGWEEKNAAEKQTRAREVLQILPL